MAVSANFTLLHGEPSRRPPQEISGPDPVQPANCTLTVLKAPGKRLAKIWRRDGSKLSYDKAAEFAVRRVPIPDFDAFATLLDRLESRAVRFWA